MDAEAKGPEHLKAASLIAVGISALVIAFAAALIIAPGSPPDAASVTSSRFFDQAAIERAGDYRSQVRLLGIGAILIQFILLSILAFNRGSTIKRLLGRLERRPYPGAALAGAGIALAVGLAQLPFAYLTFEQGREFGLVTQQLGGWFGDRAALTGIACLLAAAGALLAMLLWRKLGRRFWIAGSVLVATWAVVVVWLWPVVVTPLFNDFEPLPEGGTRSEVLSLAARAGVGVREVYEVDASRRSSALNAYVNGIGPTKRVVLYDNSIDQLSDAELSALIAHELGHVAADDLYRGLGFAILVIPLAVLFVQISTAALVRRRGDDPNGPGVIPALALTIALATLVLGVPGNLLSRKIEIKADQYALELTGRAVGMVGLQSKLARSNLSDPDPPGIYQFVFGTHPTTLERLALAERFRREEGS